MFRRIAVGGAAAALLGLGALVGPGYVIPSAAHAVTCAPGTHKDQSGKCIKDQNKPSTSPEKKAPKKSAPSTPKAAPKNGAPTAKCKDGTNSYATHHEGACSNHGGVANWLR